MRSSGSESSAFGGVPASGNRSWNARSLKGSEGSGGDGVIADEC